MRQFVKPDEVEFSAIRSQGPGGQNVNKVATAVHLRFDIARSSLPERVKARLLASRDSRVTEQGIIVIKAQSARTRDRNKADALARLQAMVDEAAHVPAVRRPTRPTLASQRRRLDYKATRSEVKAGRAKTWD